MRICSMTRSTPFHAGTGGMETIHWDILVGLAARGHEVVCITTDSLQDRPASVDGIRMVYVPGRSTGYTDAWLSAAADAAEAAQPDAVLSNSAGAHALVRRSPTYPVVMQTHSTLIEELKNRFVSRSPRRMAGALKQAKPIVREIRSLPRYTSVVATAHNARADLEAYPRFMRPQRIDFIHNAVSVSSTFRRALKKPDSLKLLFMSRLEKYKGLRLLLDAMTLLPHATLSVASSSPAFEDYAQYAQSLGIADRVAFLGRLDRETEIPAVLAESDVLVSPSLGPEGLLLSVLEALAAGVPVVATQQAVAAFGEDLPSAILVCEPTAKDLAGKIVEASRMELTESALPREMMLESMISGYEALLEELKDQS